MTLTSADVVVVPRSRVPYWVWVVSAFYLPVAVAPLVVTPTTDAAAFPYLLFDVLKSIVDASVFYWAAGRIELGRRMRQAIRLCAMAYTGSAILWAWDTAAAANLLPPSGDSGLIFGFASFALMLAGIFHMPTVPARPTDLRLFALDLVASALGVAAVLVVLVTLPNFAAQPGDRSVMIFYGVTQVLVLVGLTAYILRGLAWPTPRAFWLFATVITGNILVVTLGQFPAGNDTIGRWPHLFSALASLLTVWTAHAYRSEPIPAQPTESTPAWFASFNPVPLVATAGIGALLVQRVFQPGGHGIRILVVVLLVQVTAMIGRLFLTSRENERLQREEARRRIEEAERERHRQAEKMAAVGRLAGGMAHWYNNLLTTVIGHAYLGSLEASGNPAVEQDFDEIRRAAERAAGLTEQLLSFSGRHLVRRAPVTAAAVAATAERLSSEMRPGVQVRVENSAPEATCHADPKHVESILHELMNNARDAMPRGGALAVRIRTAAVDGPLADAVLQPAPGHCLVLDVEDQGTGVPADVASSVFDPFFTTKPIHSAAGLGLASVYGTVAAHHGGLTFRSTPGRGTLVSVYLPQKG